MEPRRTEPVTAGDVIVALQGIKFPASREEIVRYAGEHQAPDRVEQRLERLPDRTYGGMDDLRLALREEF